MWLVAQINVHTVLLLSTGNFDTFTHHTYVVILTMYVSTLHTSVVTSISKDIYHTKRCD